MLVVIIVQTRVINLLILLKLLKAQLQAIRRGGKTKFIKRNSLVFLKPLQNVLTGILTLRNITFCGVPIDTESPMSIPSVDLGFKRLIQIHLFLLFVSIRANSTLL